MTNIFLKTIFSLMLLLSSYTSHGARIELRLDLIKTFPVNKWTWRYTSIYDQPDEVASPLVFVNNSLEVWSSSGSKYYGGGNLRSSFNNFHNNHSILGSFQYGNNFGTITDFGSVGFSFDLGFNGSSPTFGWASINHNGLDGSSFSRMSPSNVKYRITTQQSWTEWDLANGVTWGCGDDSHTVCGSIPFRAGYGPTAEELASGEVVTSSSVPEPSVVVLFCIGLLGFSLIRIRKKLATFSIPA